MNEPPATPTGPASHAETSDIAALVRRLAEAEAALRAALTKEMDTIALPAGHSYLLADAQQALVASEARAKDHAALLGAIVENAPDFITYIGLDGRIRYANRVAPDLTRDDVVGAEWLALQDPRHRGEMKAVFDRVVATGVPASFEGPRTGKDGAVTFYSRRFGAVRRDGEIVGVVVITRDVTERHRMEEEAREARALAESILSTVQEPFVVLDGRLRIVSANSAFLRAFDLPAEGARGKDFYDVADREWDTPRLRSVLNSVLPEKLEVDDFEVEHVSTSEGRRTMLLNARRLQRPDGAGALMLLGLRDVTERDEHVRLIERQRQLQAANEELDAFAHSVSHDLRAPLRAIGGFARILDEDHGDALGDDGIQLVRRITKNVERMGQLIEDLLSFARLARREPDVENVDMEALVTSVVEDLSIPTSGRTIDVQVEELPTARCDPGLVRQVWENLVGNAIKYTRRRETARIRISGTGSANEVVYSIADNGAGFDMKYASKLFGVFQRLHSEAQFEGTGVGLSLVRRIVTRHGGRVWAEATPEVGATFYFTLPRG